MMATGDSTEVDVEQFFDETACAYDRAYGSSGAGGRLLRSRAAAVVELLGDDPADVLDAGMGTGYLCAELDRRGWAVSGLDIAPAMVDGAIARLPHLRDRLVRGSITALPFPDASFDAVVATGVLEYVVPELPRAAGELVRVLRPGGVAVVSFPNYRAPVIIWRGRVVYPLVRVAKRVVPAKRSAPPRMPRLAFSRFCARLEQSGLRVEEVRPVGRRAVGGPSGSRLAFLLSPQLVVRARKPGS